MKNVPFHEGEIEVQERAGVAREAQRVGAIIHDTLPDVAAAFLRAQSFAALAAADADGRVWASPLSGPPGFLFAADERTIYATARLLPDDLLPESVPTPVGLLAIDFATRRRMRVNGTAERSGDRLQISIAQAYSNCPKYIQARDITEPAPPFDLAERPATIFTDRLTNEMMQGIRRADTFFIATVRSDRSGGPDSDADVSHRGGNPGFITVTDEGKLFWDDYAGNNMFNTLGNLAVDSRAGLLFADFDTGDALQLTGAATVLWNGASRRVEFTPTCAALTRAALSLRWRLREYSPFNP